MFPMANERNSGIQSPGTLTGMFFRVEGELQLPLVLPFGLPVFTGMQQVADAERWFSIPPGRVLEITDGPRFYAAAVRQGLKVVVDPRIIDGQVRYDLIEIEKDPTEVS
jgi:hypothetical protein